MADDLTRLEILELTGQQRGIAISGRAMAYRGIPFGRGTRTRKTMYAGNPRGTIQVLGPDWDNTSFGGIWKDRFVKLPGSVTAIGFPEIFDGTTITAEKIISAFESIQLAGNALRISHGRWVREGVMKRFTPTPGLPNGSDCQWECEFEWIGDGVATQSTAAGASPDPRGQLRSELANTTAAANNRPRAVRSSGIIGQAIGIASTIASAAVAAALTGGLDASPVGLVRATQAETRTLAGSMFDALRTIQGSLGAIPSTQVAALVTLAESMRVLLETERELLADTPRTVITDSDGVVDLITVEAWRRTLSFQQEVMRNGCLQRARNALDQLMPGALLIVTVPGETTLRKLALRYYGSSDDWQTIADANGFDSSAVPAGTIVVIPPLGTNTG